MALRVTQVYVQVLRSYADQAGISVSATTGLNFSVATTAAVPIKNVRAISTITLSPATVGGGDIEVSGFTGLILSANGRAANSSIYVSAVTSLGFSESTYRSQPKAVSASGGFSVADLASARKVVGPNLVFVSAVTGITLTDQNALSARRIFRVSALTTMNLPASTLPAVTSLLRNAASAGVRFSDRADARRVGNASATTVLSFSGSAGASRDVFAVATTSLGLSPTQKSNRFEFKVGNSTFSFADLAAAYSGGKEAKTIFGFFDRADATVLLPAGGGVPGGANTGMRTVLLPSVSGEFPNSYAETPSGLILIANGIDRMVRWDGLTGQADTAGVLPPAAGIELGGLGVGTIIGRRVAYVRFIDKYGNVSNLSPVSNETDFGRDGLIERVSYDASNAVTVMAYDHGLSTGDAIVIEGVQGLELANGTWTITRIDADSFRINNLVIGTGRHTGGGRWIYGTKYVGYGNVPVPTEPKVVRRQILRNLDGNLDTLYVDLDTDDLTATAFLSTKDDAALSSGEPVALTGNSLPFANRYGTPPSHKAILASHLGRIWAAGDVAYDRGNCQPAFGRKTIQGVGTAWRASMVGRLIYMVGARAAYEIAAVDEAAQVITTTETITDSLGKFADYAIRPNPGERKFVYFTEPALPEAWPAWNAVSLPEDSDDITGLMVKGSFLFVLEKRHVYKLTMDHDPGEDLYIFLTTRRGCVNNRCHVQVEDTAYLLDEVGLYQFDGQQAEPISTPIQSLFQQIGTGLVVNWQADQRYWHAAHDPVKDTIRWFVAMTGHLYPRHAICYNYRQERFWIEEYPFAVTSSTIGTIGYRRSIAGSESRRVLCLGEGALDAVDAGNGLRGSVTSAGPLTLTDSSAPFPAGLAGAPVSIAQGKGVGQQRKIAGNTSDTLRVDRPWLVRPDATSVYQIGGVNWSWQSGWFRYVDGEVENSRDVEVIYQPVKGDSSINMRLYYDHGDEPRKWSRTIAQDGVSTLTGQPEITVDMRHKAGFAAHRQGGHRDPYAPGDRYVSVEIAGVQAGDIRRVYAITLNGATQP